MQQANPMCDCLIQEFIKNHMEKMFYFCLKKTGNNSEADDLVQDITLNIISALKKGMIPTSFSAWVWQIARNRYSVWADRKRRRNESVTGSDIGDYEIEDENKNLPDEMIRSEQMSLLRRELAFIKNEYRNIVIAYYIENRSVQEIALSQSLSTSTVQQRLYRARIILKEGMDMAREFGKRSYHPEDVTFAASGSQPSGLPWRVVQRKIPKNILLHASNNPSTLEELSMELGIALPYMEEEVEILHRATLLKKCGNKYITNFVILDRECRLDIYHALRSSSKERSRLIQEFICDKQADIRHLGIAGEHIDDNTIRWWLVPKIIDYFIEHVGKDTADPPIRENGESWGFVGYESVELPEKIIMGHNGTGNPDNMFWTYKYDDYSLWNQCGEPDYEEVMLMCECLRKNRLITSFSDNEKRLWHNIDGKYVHADKAGEMVSDILVITVEKLEKIFQFLKEYKNYEPLTQNFKSAYEKVKEILKKSNNKILHDTIEYNIRMELCSMRMMAVHDCVDNGFLQLPDEPCKSSLGMYLLLT